jgi:hypothetical protein
MISFLVGNDDRKIPEWQIDIRYEDEEDFIGYVVMLSKIGREQCETCKRDIYKTDSIIEKSWDSLCDALWNAVKQKLNIK